MNRLQVLTALASLLNYSQGVEYYRGPNWPVTAGPCFIYDDTEWKTGLEYNSSTMRGSFIASFRKVPFGD